MINRISNMQGTQHIYNSSEKPSPVSKKSVENFDRHPTSIGVEPFMTYSATGAYQSQGIDYGNIILDKGTATETTVFINRSAFDTIVQHSTYNEPQWDELGCDDEKRWVVIKGQRFEVPHSPEEKAMIKRMRRTLVDILDDLEEEKKSPKSSNMKALKSNEVVMDMLEDIFGYSSDQDLWQGILS